MRPYALAVVALIVAPRFTAGALAQTETLTSAPITDVRYDVTYDSATSIKRNIGVVMSFTTRGPGDVLLSLPAWTPGEYEIQNFVRNVMDFAATEGSTPAAWDKVD